MNRASKYSYHPDQGKDVIYSVMESTSAVDTLPGKILRRGFVGDRVDLILFVEEGTTYQLGAILVEPPAPQTTVLANTCWIAPWCR